MEFFNYKKPTTPSQRNLIQLNNKHTQKTTFTKTIKKGKINKAGKNNSGKITVRYRGGGHKKKIRIVEFNRNKDSIGITCSIEYDPNRNANIASVYEFNENRFFYILAPDQLTEGSIIKTGKDLDPKIGYSMPISDINVGSFIHNVSPKLSKPGQISRSAGTFSKLIEKTLDSAKIELSSGEQRLLSPKCYATIGIVSNEFSSLTNLGKAGRSRWLNRRPKVRGVAMNPVDHPHGGGEGKKSGSGKNLWGKPVKQKPNKKIKNKLVIKKYNE
jgi:large subunit ribosomal protein L2